MARIEKRATSATSVDRPRWPLEALVKLKEQCLMIRFEDGVGATLSAEFLRIASPSTEAQKPGPSQGGKTGRRLVSGKRKVAITGAENVDDDALRFIFDDGYDTGIYSWDYLYELAQNQEKLWSQYLALLEARGLSRDL